jgi:hypothetical protein
MIDLWTQQDSNLQSSWYEQGALTITLWVHLVKHLTIQRYEIFL